MRGLVVALVVLTGVFAGANARADELTAAERVLLARHETVTREQTIERGDQRYIGGVTYTLVDASPAEVAALVDDADALRKVLPRTKRARFVGQSGSDRFLELTQGTSVMEASFTVRLRRDANEARFWLEPSYPHGIDDAWGFFRWQPWTTSAGEPAVLLTYAVLVDVGPGIVRELFEERFRAALLSVPQHVRRQLADRALAIQH